MKTRLILILSAVVLSLPCRGGEVPQTDRSKALLNELLVKLDSTDMYAARREAGIEAVKSGLAGKSGKEQYDLYCRIAVEYSNYIADSARFYLNKAIQAAEDMKCDSLKIKSELSLAGLLAITGYYTEAYELLSEIPRNRIKGELVISYYWAETNLYHSLYAGSDEPEEYKKKYRERYTVFRDSLLAVSDPMSEEYLRNLEKKEARAGNFAEARRCNEIRRSLIDDPNSNLNAKRLYDSFTISYIYEHNLTGEALEDLLLSAIIEVENSNQDIASLLRVETILLDLNDVKSAKKISDYYYSTMWKFGSRWRRLEGLGETMEINARNLLEIQKKNKEIQLALAFISLLVIGLGVVLFKNHKNLRRITELNESLKTAGKISKGYVGVFFQQYSFYIKRLEEFRTKIHSNLKRGNVDQALKLTSTNADSTPEEIKEMYRNFDSAFVKIFPDFIDQVNGCLKPESKIIPKNTEILNTELRILALVKLGISDTSKISEMLHCSTKTVYNLRSAFHSRLSISDEEFDTIFSNL